MIACFNLLVDITFAHFFLILLFDIVIQTQPKKRTERFEIPRASDFILTFDGFIFARFDSVEWFGFISWHIVMFLLCIVGINQ